MIKLKKTTAYLLLLVLVFDMFRPYMAKASTSKGNGGDAPVAASANNFVDLFTGNFKYSVPLMVVPGPNGEAVDISANYMGGGGVTMNQPASWIGLGWDLSPGEISREVIYTHDDNDGQQNVYLQYNTPSITGLPNQANEVYNTGTLATSNNRPSYLANFGYLYSGSSVQSTGVPEFFGGSDNQFKTAGFDNYYVSGPGISGKMSPHSIWNTSTQASVNTQFLMNNSTNLNVADISSTDFNVSTARFNSGYYIKYYKTTDIAGDKYSSSNKDGFIEYAGQGFSRSTYGASDFAGFKITTPAGISYHYSLPVYCNEEYKYTFDCDFTTSSPSLSGNVSLAKKVVPYVTSWKLTAITGPDYVDSDNSATVSDGDQGYWVSYNYSLWCNNYLWASDYYNATTNMIYSGLKDVTEYLYGSGAPLVTYQNIRNNILKQHNQIYYLNSIKTATHTAFFIKDLRLDEISYDKIQNLGSGNPVPLQKLNKIILLRNEDAWLLNNSGAPTSNGSFDVSNCNPNGDNLHIGKYNANSAQIDLKSLKTIEFNTDYSLCPSYHKNINCSFTPSYLRVTNGNSNAYNQFKTVNNNSDLICTYSNPANFGASCNTTNQCGKLTLNEIKTYETGKTKVYPSYQFGYVYNPTYDNTKVDYWGYYKDDFDITHPSNYTTTGSSGEWCLTDITIPLGGKIHVAYTPDSYTRDGNGSVAQNLIPFFITSCVIPSQPWKDGQQAVNTGASGLSINSIQTNNPDFYSFLSNSTSCTMSIPVNAYCAGGNGVASTHYIADNLKWYLLSGSTSAYNYAIDITQQLGATNGHLYSGMCGAGVVVYPSTTPFPSGSAYFDVSVPSYNGGGVKVTSITISNPPDGSSYTNSYLYSDGFTKTEPMPFDRNISTNALYFICNSADYFGLTPLVTYGNTTVTTTASTGQQNNGMVSYVFSNMRNMPVVNGYGGSYNSGANEYETQNNDLEMYGKLLDVYYYSGNANLLSSTYGANLIGSEKYSYTYGNQITDIFEGTYIRHYRASFLTKTVTFKDGITTTTTIDARDPATCQPTSITVTDPSQGVITKATQLAYTQSAYSTMGLKNINPSYQNNLMAVSQTTSVKWPLVKTIYGDAVPDLTDLGRLIGGNKYTYTQQVPYRGYNSSTLHYSTATQTKDFWKPYESYELITDNVTPGNQTSLNWRKTSSNTTYNANTQGLLETQGLNSRYSSAVKMGYNNQYKIASSSDANLNDFAFSSFEDGASDGVGYQQVYGGEITSEGNNSIQEQTPVFNGNSAVNAHTGNYVVQVGPQNYGYGPGFITTNFDVGRTYQASVWVHSSSPNTCSINASLDGSINGTPTYLYESTTKNDPSNITVNGWTLMTVNITVPSSYVASNGTQNQNDLRFFVSNTGSSANAYFDDLSVHPIDAPITGYVYNPFTGWLLSTLDNDNFSTKYDYDQAGRVINIYKETKNGVKKISSTAYNLGRP